MNYQQTLDYIYSFIDYETMHAPRSAANYDLRRMDELLTGIGNPQLAAKSVHIAGTKGKGSVAAMIASALSVAGYSTGLYTSPHLIDLRERIMVNGEMIGKRQLMALTAKLKPAIEEVNRKATYGQLTTFEVLTALGFAYFQRQGVKFQVLEVGLGGRLDATNVINPEVAIITSLSYDHCEVLGHTLAEIAAEKAGIIKPGGIVVAAPHPPEAARVVEQACLKRGAKLVRLGKDVTWQGIGFDTTRQTLEVKGRLSSYRVSIPLLGRHQLENAALAVAALEVLAEKGYQIFPNHIMAGLAKVRWPGRLQVLSREPLLIVDGAHNLDSAQKLRQALQDYFGLAAVKAQSRQVKPAVLVFGMSCDKDMAGIVSALGPLFDRVIVTRSRHPRAMESAPVVAEFKKYGAEVHVAEAVPAALELALSTADTHGLVCVTGSLFVVGETIEQIERTAF